MKKKVIITFTIIVIASCIYNILPEQKLPSGVKIDSIVVYKSKRELILYSEGKLQKTYHISLGSNPIGAKEFEGDKKTPEGIYIINDKNSKSAFYKNLGISYPNEKDIEYSKKIKKPTGGDIKIHGTRNGFGWIGKFHRFFDWTAGCIALTNSEVDELYSSVDTGTKIEIKK